MFDQNVLTGFYIRRTSEVIKYACTIYTVKPSYEEYLHNETLFHQALFWYIDT